MREEEGFHWTQRGKKRGRGGGGGWEEELLPSAVLPPASFSPSGHVHHGEEKLDSLPPSLISPLAVFLYLSLNLWNLGSVLLLPSLPVTLRPSIFATLHCFSQLFCLHLHPPSPSSILLSALSLSVKHYRSPLRPSIASRSGPIVVWSWLEPEIRSDPAAVISRRRPSLLTDNLLLSGNTQKNLPLHLFSTIMRLHHTDAAAAGGKYIRGT